MCTLNSEDEARLKALEVSARKSVSMTAGTPAFQGAFFVLIFDEGEKAITGDVEIFFECSFAGFKWQEWTGFADVQMSNAGCPFDSGGPRQSKELEREVIPSF